MAKHGNEPLFDSVPASVVAMADDPQAPTAPLNEFLVAMVMDDNWWWRVGCGHHLNLFDEAVERMTAAVEMLGDE